MSTSKEAARRAAIMASYVAPPPIEPQHPTRDDERPKYGDVVKRAILALPGEPFEIEEYSATNWDFPRWKTENPDDANLSYVAEPLVVYHLAAQRTMTPGTLAAVEVMYLGGKPIRSRYGIAGPDGFRGTWHSTPITQLARAIREHS